MAFNSTNEYMGAVKRLASIDNVPDGVIGLFTNYTMKIYRSDEESQYSKPMLWIGMYIALASLICIFAMVGDLYHGLRTRKLWFPCKYFKINAASLTVIGVAMKLPVDLSAAMPGNVDQVAKLGSMAFMCSMMANLLPSLATMCSEELLANIVGLVVLVITLVVNICIQIATGVVSNEEKDRIYKMVKPGVNTESLGTNENLNKITATIQVTLLLMLLIIHICSSLAILKSKQSIDSKYQHHARALKDQQSGRLTLEGLKQHVTKYWIMGGTGSPQFITVCSATTSASGVICVLSTITHIYTVLITSSKLKSKNCESDYQWSMLVILVTQFIGVVVGTIAPLSRCFAALNFKMSIKRSWPNHINVFEIESYWIEKLSDWKKSSIPITFRSYKLTVVLENLKSIILSFLIEVQEVVVKNVTCCASDAGLEKNTHQQENYEDLSQYVLLHEEKELHEKTLKSLLKSMNRLIQKQAEKRQPNNLMRLLKKSSGFEGVEKFDNDHVPTISSKKYLDCWSLPVVTLTAIVVSLPNIEKDIAKEFLKSVSEAFTYVTLVDESLNATSDYVSIQKAAKKLWLEVGIYHKWFGHELNDSASEPEVSVRDILQWFSDTAKDIVTKVGSTKSGGPNDDSIYRSICANSMYRITETVMLSNQANINQVRQEDLFAQLSSMISDIVAACLTNLPEAIALKCHSSKIEKREADVHAAAQLFGQTKQIIKLLQGREPQSLNADDFPFIHKWRAYLRHPSNFRSSSKECDPE
ncbi:hypothetical protein CTI12_AA104990 [Artemisia annua]|uniref:Uncharacterized protein n=1 Tax=Artemisia annua TaxID=35608 RepID=A0A2U1PWA0_ARTAN|nr:hypothetical protein CTI12_AA104990 [Artemisia annua]